MTSQPENTLSIFRMIRSAAPTFEGDLWLATSGGLHRSSDSGESFLQVSGVQVAQSIGFVKPAIGATYPAAYLPGQPGTPATAAMWKSNDYSLDPLMPTIL